MAFERNRPATNPNRKPMSIANMNHPISKENQKVLKMLGKMNNKMKDKE